MPGTAASYRALFSNMLSGLAFCRVLTEGPAPFDFVYLEVNDAFETLTGLRGVEGKRVTEVLPGIRETDPGLLEIYGRVATTGNSERFERRVEALQMWFSVSVFCPSKDHFVAIFDVTTDRILAASLRESEERYRSIVTAMGEGVVMHDASGAILTCNAAAERILGLSRDQIAGRTWIDPRWRAIHEDGSPFPGEEHPASRTLRSGEAQRDVVMGVHLPDGAVRWISISSEPVGLQPTGRPDAVVATFADITDRKAALAALRASEERSRTLFEGHSAVMLLVDPGDGAIVDANPAAARFYGYPQAAMRAMSIAEINCASQETLRQRLAEAAGHRQNTFVFCHRLADGTLRTVEVNASPVEIEGRALLFSIVQDITERERAKDALERERQRYRSLLSISQDGIHVLDDTGTLVEASDVFLRMLGQPPEAVGQLNMHDWDAAIPAGQLAERVRRLIAVPELFLTQHRRSDGRVFDVEVHAGGIELEGKPYLLATARDITARLESERQLHVKQAELAEMNDTLEARIRETVGALRAKDQLLLTQSRHAAMGEMIGNIAHQWRQPLNALGLVLANLQDSWRLGELDSPTMRKAVLDANRLIQKMSGTINDFRNFFRPEKARRAFSALAQVREIIRLLGASFHDANVGIEVVAASEPRLDGFANEYSQVLLNVLSNALQAIQQAKAERGYVRIWVGERDGLGCVTVRDNGGGVPAAVLGRIFEPYFSTKDGGTGVGLYMSRQIIEANMGGRIEVCNREGGAEFAILVPLARP